MDVEVGMPMRVDLVDGMPRVYVPDDVRHELEHVERGEDPYLEKLPQRQLHEGKGLQIVHLHNWPKIQPFPPLLDDIYMARRSARAALPYGVKVNDPPAWDLGPRAP